MKGMERPDAANAPRTSAVDDDPGITKVIARGLNGLGSSVDACDDPFDALARFKPSRYSLSRFDVRMPRMNGFKLLGETRQIDGHTMLVFMTASETHDLELKMIFPGTEALAVLERPFSALGLVNRLEECLRIGGGFERWTVALDSEPRAKEPRSSRSARAWGGEAG